MSTKCIIIVCVLIAAATALPAQGGPDPGWGPPAVWGTGVNPWIPPWVASAPWYPKWVACTGIGNTCLDCSTRLVCTKVGGLQRACTDPTLPYCNLGECSAIPTVGCGPAPAPPALTPV